MFIGKEKSLFLVSTCIFLFLTSTSVLASEITGTIKYEGEVPQLRPLRMSADPACEAKHDSPPIPEVLILGDNNTMGNVFVRIKSGVSQKEYKTPTDPVVITQEGCIYNPRVFGVMVGQPVKFLNKDGILHNVHALSKDNKPFNLGMPASMTEAEKKFLVEEWMFPIKCDVHPWMISYAAVMTHPYFDVTNKDGAFTIKNLEPGTYEVEAWHERLGTQTSSITIGTGESKTVDFTFTR
jgi:plastocyanin